MYKLKYDFKKYNSVISEYIEILTNSSADNFQNQINNGQVIDKKHDADALAGCIQNLEEYLYYNFKKSPETFDYFVDTIMDKVKTISVLPSNNRGIYGRVEMKNKIIYINPDLLDSKHLKREERTRLYIAHELGHVINNEWMNKVIEYANQQIRQGKSTQEHLQLIYDGFSLLDEATTQNRAENFVYEFSGKRRPSLTYCKNGQLYNSETYKSNFDYYGELEEPAIMFARTLRGIGKEEDDIKALDMLSARALSPNFFNKILDEYTKDEQIPAFMQTVQCLGLLKRVSYANFGYEDRSYLLNSKTYLKNLRSISTQMRDYREPFDKGYGER